LKIHNINFGYYTPEKCNLCVTFNLNNALFHILQVTFVFFNVSARKISELVHRNYSNKWWLNHHTDCYWKYILYISDDIRLQTANFNLNSIFNILHVTFVFFKVSERKISELVYRNCANKSRLNHHRDYFYKKMLLVANNIRLQTENSVWNSIKTVQFKI
jgi:hypothetical protein